MSHCPESGWSCPGCPACRWPYGSHTTHVAITPDRTIEDGDCTGQPCIPVTCPASHRWTELTWLFCVKPPGHDGRHRGFLGTLATEWYDPTNGNVTHRRLP